MSKLNRLVVTYPKLTIALFLAVTAVVSWRIPELQIEPDVRSMMPQGHPAVVYNDWVEDYFDIQDPAVFIVVNDGEHGMFTPDNLALVERLSTAMGDLDSIDEDDLVSLSEVDNITGDDDMLDAEPFFDEVPATQDQADAVRDAVFDNEMMVGTLVSKDGHATVIIGELYEGRDKVALYADLRKIVAATEIPAGTRVLIAGRPVIEGEMGVLAKTDLQQMFPLVIAAAALLLLLALRSLRGVFLPLLVVFNSVLWAVGMMAWTGATFFAITTMMPSLLVAVGVANGIHIIHHFMLGVAGAPDRRAAETVYETMQQMTPQIVMTSLTTAAGIGSLAVSIMRPIQGFGIFGAVGVLAGMVFSLTLLPAVLCVLPLPRRAAARTLGTQTKKGGVATFFLDAVTAFVLHRPYVAVGAAVIVVAFGLAGLPKLEVESSMLENFTEQSPVKAADEEYRAYFGGSHPMQIIVDAREDGGWKDPAKLRALEGLQRHMEAQGYTGRTRSIADYIKRMNQVMNPHDPDAYRIPDSRELIAQYLLLYSMSGDPGDFDDVVDYDYRLANLRARLASDRSGLARYVIEDVETYAAENLAPAGISTHVSGLAQVNFTFVSMIVQGQARSLAVALVIVAILASIMCRSVTAGLLTVLPVAIATVLNFGLMAWAGVRLGVATALVSSMSIGIGVDYAIHFIFRYRQDCMAGMTPEAAMRETLSTSGVAIFYNAMVVLAGFLMLATSQFPPNKDLGVLVSINMFVCFLGTVTLLAAVLHILQPAFLRSEGSGGGQSEVEPLSPLSPGP